MSTARQPRVNALVLRELGEILRTRFGTEAVRYTITDVDVTPDLRRADVYYSVLGNAGHAEEADLFFTQNGKEIRHELSRRITLKYLPELHFHNDPSLARGTAVNDLLDSLEVPDPDPEP
jgi:ribosome-binding factor A